MPPKSLPCDYDPERVFSSDQLEVLDILVHPVWIFDSVDRRMRWANTAGLKMWNASTRDDLFSRSFQDMSDSSVKRCEALMIECEKGRNISDEWTLYPKGKAKTVHMNVSGLRLSEDDNHISLLCEGIPYVKEELLNERTRGVEMLRHLPIAVCQFDMNGSVLYQNPEAMLALEGYEDNEVARATDKSNQGSDDDQEDNNSVNSANTLSSASTSSSGTVRRIREAGGLLNRFVDPVMGQKVLEAIQRNESYDLEAELKTRVGQKSCMVQLRKSKDPVTSEDVILFSARDNSDAHRAEQERIAREQKSEFFAIMAHEVRVYLFIRWNEFLFHPLYTLADPDTIASGHRFH